MAAGMPRPLTRLLRLTWGRVVAGLIIMLACLQVLHMSMLSRLEERHTRVRASRGRAGPDPRVLWQGLRAAITLSNVVDSSGEYRLVNGLHTPRPASTHTGAGAVTLVSQCSVNHLPQLPALLAAWDGPVSVAVFAPADHGLLAARLVYVLHVCVPSFRTRVTVHAAYPLTQPPRNLPTTLPHTIHCDNLSTILDAILKAPLQNYAIKGLKYPNNLLRNLAVRNAVTDFVLVVDIDMRPSPGLYRQFGDLIRHPPPPETPGTSPLDPATLHPPTPAPGVPDQPALSDTVYVVPAFEVQDEADAPADKPALLRRWGARTMRPFYWGTCWRCQRATDYPHWRNLSLPGPLRPAYGVTWSDPWEPFYIAPRRHMPLYDERFKQYGFNRISQACELHVAGFQFLVLNHAFLLHVGYKTPDAFHLSKDAEQDANRLLFRRFKDELKVKYPDTDRRCH